jgi:ribose/xylose/arabinose/galactoside ABC-type transport system permease subunit/ABC-type branched-subunit amino acid transport system ATPase component
MASLSSSTTALRGIGSRRRDPVPGEASGRIGLALLALGLFVFFSARYDNFSGSDNLLSIATSNSAILIAAIGSMALLVSGNIDISIGSMYGLISMLVAYVAVHTGSALLAVGTGVAAGIVLGGFNGLLVRKLTISPIIVTLATFGLYRGLASVISGGASISGFSDSFLAIGRGGIGRITWPIIIAVVVFVAVSVWVTRTRTGLRIYAIGGDKRAAALNGVAVGRIVLQLYTLNGALIGILAVLTTARLNLGNPTTGTGFEFDVLTAAILGGIAFAGGGGRPIGVFVGVLVLGVINAGLIFENLQDFWQQIVKGGLLLIALAADQYAQHRREHRKADAPSGAGAGGLPAEPSIEQALPALAADAQPRVVLEATGMTKRYGALVACDRVDMAISSGEVVCVIGDNGAGKSTFIKMISGAVAPDEGEIRVDGRRASFATPKAAQDAGIKTVYQDLALCPNLSVAHNFVLGHEPVRRLLGLVPLRDDAEAEKRAERYLANLGIRLSSYRTVVRMLSGGQRQSLAIARAVEEAPLVAILDEPTAALGVTQTRNVLDLVKAVARRGTAVILISHDVQTVMELADRIVVLRLGRVVHDGPVAALSKLELLELMAGITEPKPLEALDAKA